MAVNVSPWVHYLMAIQSQGCDRILGLQRAENVLLTVLDQVTTLDPRFGVDYFRDHEAWAFSLRTTTDGLEVDVPLRLDAEALTVQKSNTDLRENGEAPNGQPRVLESTYDLAVPEKADSLEPWRQADVFQADGGAKGTGNIVPGKVIKRLKELLVAAIVHCKLHALIVPGCLSAEKLDTDDLQVPLLVQCGPRMVQFNMVPVVRRPKDVLKLDRKQSEIQDGVPPTELLKAAMTLGVTLVPATSQHWSYSYNPLVSRLLDRVASLGGHRIDSLSILDRVNHDHWRDEGNTRGLTFFHLKMVLFWATELFPSPEDWEDIEASVYRLLVILLSCLATRNLPDFLSPERNLFQGEDLDLGSIYFQAEAFANMPEKFLRIHVTHRILEKCQRVGNGIKTFLQLPTTDREYWATPFFDALLDKFQVYHIQDKDRVSAMKKFVSQSKKLATDQR